MQSQANSECEMQNFRLFSIYAYHQNTSFTLPMRPNVNFIFSYGRSQGLRYNTDICSFFFELRFPCIVLAVLEFALQTRLASNSLPLPLVCWIKSMCHHDQRQTLERQQKTCPIQIQKVNFIPQTKNAKIQMIAPNIFYAIKSSKDLFKIQFFA